MRGIFKIMLACLIAATCGCWKKSAPVVVQANEFITEDQAKVRILSLPQTIEFARKLDASTQGLSAARTNVFAGPGQCEVMCLPPSWLIDVIEHNREGSKLWTRFRVDAMSGAIYVWYPASNSYMTVKEWQDRVARGIVEAYNTAITSDSGQSASAPSVTAKPSNEGNTTSSGRIETMNPSQTPTPPAVKPNLPPENKPSQPEKPTNLELKPMKPADRPSAENKTPAQKPAPARQGDSEWNLPQQPAATAPAKTEQKDQNPPKTPATKPAETKSSSDWNLPAKK